MTSAARDGGRAPAPSSPSPSGGSLLWADDAAAAGADGPTDRSYASDLNLDQVAAAIAGEREEHDLVTDLFYRQRRDAATIRYRHDVFRDLEGEALLQQVRQAVALLGRVRSHLAQLAKMRAEHQRNGWFLDAVAVYCEVVSSLRDELDAAHLASEGLGRFRDILDAYARSSAFTTLAAETADRKRELGAVRYCVRIRGGRVEVSRYEAEPDYSAEILETFDRFKQGEVKDYRVQYRGWPGMNHVGEQILAIVARLFDEEFSALDAYCRRHRQFFDPAIRRFEQEIQFYLSYLDYTAPLRGAGLAFCYPEVGSSKEVFAEDTFDLALARKLVGQGDPVVRNDLRLSGSERIFVVSGPNQGGKTTFARTFGQLHHLASVGYPVPGSAARTFLFDRLYTHFEREEDPAEQRGKLEDDLVRIGEVLATATADSILIMNEVFSSTSLSDARFLGAELLARVVQLDLLAVYVTFVDELASLDPSVVSMVSSIVPEDPARRTFKVVRGPANGLAYALAIAEKYDLTYERLRERLAS